MRVEHKHTKHDAKKPPIKEEKKEKTKAELAKEFAKNVPKPKPKKSHMPEEKKPKKLN